VEALHALENGLIPDALQVLFSAKMTLSQLGCLDTLAKQLNELSHQKYLTSGLDLLMPCLCWSDGISCLSNLETKYKVGIMLTIVVVML
jgi:hypothetical protein